MQLLTSHNGRLHAATVASFDGSGVPALSSGARGFVTGFSSLDDLLPNRAFARGAVHELLALPQHPFPLFVALLLARSALLPSQYSPQRTTQDRTTDFTTTDFFFQSVKSVQSVVQNSFSQLCGSIAWCDPRGTLYPPAVAAMGVPLERLLILRPKSIIDENWAITECLRCRGLAATVAAPRRISRIEVRRFQLAAERGGGVGILLRPYDRNAHVYAAVTRWLIAPARGERTVQKWRIQLIHGHGGRLGQAVILEHHRDTAGHINGHVEVHPQIHPLRATEQLADRPVPAPTRATA
jgi:hypothetical protein